MNGTWAKRRKFVYGALVLVVIATVFVYTTRDVLFPVATCSDGRQNGYESGIDCGGTCSLRCSQQVIPLSVTWSRAVKTAPSTYDLIALISNKNIDSAPQQAEYTFVVYDASGAEITQIKGKTLVPIDGDFPVIEQNVRLAQAPASVRAIVSSEVSYYKALENPTVPTLRVAATRYEAGSIPRVYATISNQKRVSFRDLKVRVLLYDTDGNAFAGGETVIPYLDKEGTEEVVFTWNAAFPTSPTQIKVFPILDPFLGAR